MYILNQKCVKIKFYPWQCRSDFATVLHELIENLEDSEGSTRVCAFEVITEMMKQEALQPRFRNHTELLILVVN